MWKELAKDTVPQRLTSRLENTNRVPSVGQTHSLLEFPVHPDGTGRLTRGKSL